MIDFTRFSEKEMNNGTKTIVCPAILMWSLKTLSCRCPRPNFLFNGRLDLNVTPLMLSALLALLNQNVRDWPRTGLFVVPKRP